MTAAQLVEALRLRKESIEALLYRTRMGSSAHAAVWHAFQSAARRYWRAAIYLSNPGATQ